MLSKLAYRNARRSLRDYLIYLITITLSFSLIFAFHLVAGSDAVVQLSAGMNMFGKILLFVNVIIILVVCFLINYTTKFMFEKRSKEFGTYMLLGIKKREITKMFVLENFILGFFSLLLSIPAGFLLSQFISLMVVRIFGIPDVVFITFDVLSVGVLLIYFAVIYVLVLLNMLRKMRKMTVHNFLYLEKQNEKKMFRSSKKRNIIFVLSIFLGIFSLYLWYARCNLELMGEQDTPVYLFAGIVGLIISIYGISATISDMVLTLVLKSDKTKYQSDNLFVARTFASKARTMSFTVGTLSMLTLLSVLALNISRLTKGMYDYILDSETPYDVSIFDEESILDEYVKVIEEDYTINEKFVYAVYKEPGNQIQPYISEFEDFDSVMKLSDYNKLLEMRGMDAARLSEDEFILVISSQLGYVIQEIKDMGQIRMSNGAKLKLKEVETETFWNTMNNNSHFVMVVPDECAEKLEAAESHLIVDTKEETKASLESDIEEKMSYHLCKTDSDGKVQNEYYRIRVRGAAVEGQNSITAMTASVCLYLAFIFISVVGTIFAVQSLSDSAKYRCRYLTLRRLGVNDNTLYRTIRRQMLILFGMPVAYPVIVSFCLVTFINNIYRIFLESRYTYLLYFLGGLVVFFLVYGVYWAAAYIGFKRNVNEGDALT